MKTNARILLVIVAIALLPAVVKLQDSIDPGRQQFQPGRNGAVMTDINNNPVVLPTQFVIGAFIGFREVVAGLLWVRVNDFFHSGNYAAIVPMTRMITWLDPHQIDVYGAGAWHLAYNFVDSQQRADYRYLVPAEKFLEEGVENNRGVWDPEFDLGFLLYRMKAQDFERSLYWIKRADEEKDAPPRIDRQLAHAYEYDGQIDKCIDQWKKCVADAQAAMKKDPEDMDAKSHYDISKLNLDERVARRIQRADVAKHRTDVQFEAEFKRLDRGKFIIRGKANLPSFTRIDVVLRDADYKEPKLKNFNWQIDENVTVLADIGLHGISVIDGKFERMYDLTPDKKRYPFKKGKYLLTVSFNPRAMTGDVQNVTGWNGEGITDSKYLDTSTPGLRMIRKVIHLNRSDIL